MRLEAFEVARAREVVAMWRESFEHGVGVKDPHPVEEQERFLLEKLVRQYDVCVAVVGDQVVGFVAAGPRSIAQLYVRVGWHRRRIGTRLLEWAKARSDGSLWLYTFERNAIARAFYERHGFQLVARGHEPEWKLDDCRYEWVRGS
jgi:ribosomal protein S18 acetylase RimI-like enzyme